MGNLNLIKSPEKKNDKGYLNDSIYKHIKYKFFIHRRKYPIILEDYFGMNMRYQLLCKSVGNLFVPVFWFRTQYEAKNRIIEGEKDILIENFFIENFFNLDKIRVDDIIDLIGGQRAIHIAVLFDDDELVDYLIKNDAHLMARDYNGYTPLLKAASLGRFKIVKKLIDAGVPPFHKDPWGVTPLDKALLYNHYEIINYFNELDPNKNKEKIEYWKRKQLNEKYDLSLWYMKQF
jgi:hypothetical protein